MHRTDRSTRTLALAAAFTAASTAALPAMATPPGAAARGFVDGANHHLGDAGFIAERHRAPTVRDAESARMHSHLAFVRAWLAARPATRPELAARRAELLGYLDEYIAAGTTPWNTRLPWRNPVFVDDYGNVCAVGYLIQRTAGRPLVERIASAHRYDYLEDIDMPEVRAWVASSGFTLEELASIQPGYIAPMIEQWQVWNLPARRPADGPFTITVQGIRTEGTWRHGQMEGRWTRTDAGGRIVGFGDFHAGAGHWRSTYANGVTLAEGGYAHNLASGTWRFFHESGRLAALGTLRRGNREGAWRFFHDDAEATLIAEGRFDHGSIAGAWRHFDAQGALLATGSSELSFVRAPDGLERRAYAANIEGDGFRIQWLRRGGQQLYLYSEERWYDTTGREYVHDEHGWSRVQCPWDRGMLRAAASHDLAGLGGAMVHNADAVECSGTWERLSASEGARIDALVTSVHQHRAPTPGFVRALVLQGSVPREGDGDGASASTDASASTATNPSVDTGTRASSDEASRVPADMTDVLVDGLGWYTEFPHIDGRFGRVFATLPDHFPPNALDDEASPLAPRNLYDR